MATVKEVLEFGKKFYDAPNTEYYIYDNAVYIVSDTDNSEDEIISVSDHPDQFIEEFFYEESSNVSNDTNTDDDSWWMEDQRWWGDSVYHGE